MIQPEDICPICGYMCGFCECEHNGWEIATAFRCQRDEARRWARKMKAERDAAIARAEKAEAEFATLKEKFQNVELDRIYMGAILKGDL